MLAAQPYAWNNVAINGGGFVDGLVYSPAQKGLLYARTDVGGAYRWNATNGTWIPLNDALTRAESQSIGVLSIAADPSNANNVYEAVGQYTASWAQNAGILYSSDKGTTWGRTTLPIKLGGNESGRGTGERLQVDPNQGTNLLLGTTVDGLWKSGDSGRTWARDANFPAASTTFVLYDKRSATAGNATKTIYVGVNSTTGTNLYRSTDGGTTWGTVPNAPTAGLLAYQAAMDSAGTLYVTYANSVGPNGATAGAVWKLNTGTGAWTNITPPTGQGGYAGVSVDAARPGTVIVTTLNRWYPHDDIFRSTNGGTSWTSLWTSTTTFDTSSAPYVKTMTPHWLADIEIDPFSSGTAFFGTGYGVFSSTNITAADTGAAVKWSFTNKGLEETVPTAIISPPTGAHLLTVIGDFDGFRNDDLTVSPAGGRFSPTMGTTTGLDFAQNNPSLLVRTGGSGLGYYSLDGGTTWTAMAKPTGATAGGKVAVSADGSTFVWAATGAAVSYSTNRGASWTASTGIPTGVRPVADRVTSSRFYAYDPATGYAYVSNDGGKTFAVTVTNLPKNGGSATAPFGKSGDVWIPTPAGLFRSTDGGVTFTNVGTANVAYQVGFGAAAPGNSYPAVYLSGQVDGAIGVYRSDDAGATWTQVNDAQHQYGWINAIIGDPRIYGRVYLGTGGRGVVYGDIPNAAPTVATAAAAAANPVTGRTTTLSVLGADDAGEANLTYTWATTGTPPAAVTFSANGTNAAKTATATFTKAGVYTFQVTLKDSGGLTTTSSVQVTVRQTTTTVVLSPATASVRVNAQQQFTASARDQFGTTMTTQPAFAWLIASGGGTVSGSGLFTAPGAAGTTSVAAVGSGITGRATVTVTAATAAKLTGTAIGTAGSYNNGGNTIARVFDGNLTTYFDAPSGTVTPWAGLNLGTARTITQLKFAPRSGYTARMVNGYFQVSNVADFSTATTIHTIATAPTAGVLTTVNVSVAGTWRYVRYVGPANSAGNIAEFEAWGY
ncbi:MAG TPA: discoidin domain-containing protein [Tepidisphaeraceae bacterium]|jgi:hypothetical protein